VKKLPPWHRKNVSNVKVDHMPQNYTFNMHTITMIQCLKEKLTSKTNNKPAKQKNHISISNSLFLNRYRSIYK